MGTNVSMKCPLFKNRVEPKFVLLEYYNFVHNMDTKEEPKCVFQERLLHFGNKVKHVVFKLFQKSSPNLVLQEY